MADPSYLGFKAINSDTTIRGDLVVTGSLTTTGALLIAGSEPVTFGALAKMVVTEETTTLLNFEFISTSTGEVVIYEAT